MNKKAQTHQVFFYIMVIIVIGVVVVIGYMAAVDSIKKACLIEKTSFEDKILDSIDVNKNYGSSENRGFKTPCDTEVICFLNETIPDAEVDILIPSDYKFMRAAAKAKTGDNIFLISKGQMEPLAAAEKLLIADGYLCVNATGGKFYLNIASAGYGYTQITEGQ